ncbi:MAG: DUF2877 domain-containing protein [Actinomycetaceae bacterium]|nr:DUF2877 domain-containing protein [Actinomycetaceae bacterium]
MDRGAQGFRDEPLEQQSLPAPDEEPSALGNECAEILSLDAELEAKITGPKTQTYVHSVFDKTVNLQCGDLFFTLAIAQVDDAPHTARLSQPLWTPATKPGDTGCVGQGVISLGSACARLTPSCLRWNPHLAPMSTQGKARLAHAVEVIENLRAHAPSPAHNDVYAQDLRERYENLEACLALNDSAKLHSAALRLVGLGYGLTPSGDDIITGALLVSSIPRAGLHWAVEPLTISDAELRTTKVAAVMLMHAARGRFSNALVELAVAIAAGADVRACASRVLAIGSSSGSDMLLGVLAGLKTVLALPKD